MSNSTGNWWVLGSVGALALAGSVRRGSRAALRTSIPVGTRLYHGTQAPEDFEVPDGPAWFSDSESVAQYFVRWNDWGVSNPNPRILTYEVVEDIPDLILVRDGADFDGLEQFVGELYGATSEELVEHTCWKNFNGWHIPTNYPEGSDTMLCEPENWLRLIRTKKLSATGSAARLSVGTRDLLALASRIEQLQRQDTSDWHSADVLDFKNSLPSGRSIRRLPSSSLLRDWSHSGTQVSEQDAARVARDWRVWTRKVADLEHLVATNRSGTVARAIRDMKRGRFSR